MATSTQPICYGVAAFLPDQFNFRVDTIRGVDIFNPFPTFVNEDMDLWFLYGDTDLYQNFSFGQQLTFNKIKFSLDRLDFSDAVELDLDASNELQLQSVYSQPFNQNFQIFYAHHITINPAELGFSPGDQVYVRTYVQDGDHDEPTENLQYLTDFRLKNYFSFFLLE